jgi:hypothetical protein
MGLDMYAYTANRSRDGDDESSHREISYWRKHPNLHGWMQQLWERKGRPGGHGPDDQFNGIELELTWDDLEALDQDINKKQVPATSGFFFGSNSDDRYLEHDLAFVRMAKAELFLGLKVFYNSSW